MEITMKELSELWMMYKKNTVKKTSMMQYERIIHKYIDVYFKSMQLSELTITSILTFIERLRQDELSSKTVQDIVVILKSILKYGEMIGYKVIPITAIPCPRVVQEKVSVFQDRDIQKIENYLVSHLNGRNLGLLICLYTGIRLGEVCALRWEDIDLSENRIIIKKSLQRVKEGKKSIIEVGTPKTTNSNREVPINQQLHSYLKTRNVTKEDYILTENNHYLDPRTLQYYFKKVLKTLEIEDNKFHAIRHTFATQCIQCNVDVKSLSEILGHASVNITLNKYVHSSFDVKKKQIEKLIF